MMEVLINGVISLAIAIITSGIAYIKVKKECESNYKRDIDKIAEQNKGEIEKLKQDIEGKIKVYQENKKVDLTAKMFSQAMNNNKISRMIENVIEKEMNKVLK